MPVVLNLQVTLDDATLAAIRGGTPVVVPPVVVPPVVVPPVTPPVATVPPVTDWALASTYVSAAALITDLSGRSFDRAVLLDGVSINAGFGPAAQFYTWGDGSVQQKRPPVAARKAGDALLAEYPSKAALLADAALVGWTWAILLEGVPIKEGFEADVPALYVTRGRSVVKV